MTYISDTSTVTVTRIVSLYLYGTDAPPADFEKRLRSDIQNNNVYGATLEINATDYMIYGAGRFANISQTYLAKGLFDGSRDLLDAIVEALPAGKTTVTIAELRDTYGLIVDDDIQMSVNQYQMDKESSDYDARTFIWSSGGFKVNDDAVIDLTDPQNPELNNICLRPFDDDFNYISSSQASGRDKETVAANPRKCRVSLEPCALGKFWEVNLVE